MRYGSVCSGIEAATMAWHPLGWEPAFFSEIEKFPCAALAHHYPHVPNLGDMTKFQEWPDHAIDLLVGGTPCQSFSVAGLRAGLADPRGNLMLTYLAIAARYRPRWLVWENVPGVLSSNGGRDFGTLLRGLGELGYGFAYRVLDAQFCRAHGYEWAVPQRRRRVFVVGYLGDWRRAAAVLFDGTSLRGDSPPRREAGQRTSTDVVSSLTASGRGVERTGETRGQDPVVAVQANSGDVGYCLTASAQQSLDAETETLVATVAPNITSNPYGDHESREGLLVAEVASTLPAGGNSTGGARQPGTSAETAATMLIAQPIGFGGDVARTLSARHDSSPCADRGMDIVAQPIVMMERGRGDGPSLETRQDGTANAILTPNGGRGGRGVGAVAFNPKAGGNKTISKSYLDDGSTYTLDTDCTSVAVQTAWAVRRLTPRECERLQGFPDDFTAIPYRGKPAADGPRYKALGNSMAVNVMRVIGTRIAMVDALQSQEAAA